MKKILLMVLVVTATLLAQDITLGEYKNLSQEQQKEFISKTTKDKLNDYLNCMGDFAYQKSPALKAIEVLEWCINEQKNNKIRFYSHVNELQLREVQNLSRDKVKLIKQTKKATAEKKAIKEQEAEILNKSNSKIKIYKTPREAIEALGGLFKVEKVIKPNDIVLSIGFYSNELPEVMIDGTKRTFLYGIFIPLIQTKYKKMTITVIPYIEDTKTIIKDLAFKGTIRKKDALKVAKKLLHVKKLSDLIGSNMELNGEIIHSDAPNKIFHRALYNDQGKPTLKVFFKELSKYSK